jgi:hypothetical protein
MEGGGPFRKNTTPPPPPGATPPQTTGTSGIGAAKAGACPPTFNNAQCAQWWKDQRASEETKAWAGVAGKGVDVLGGLLGKYIPQSGKKK